ncbi:YihY/virulence factor BrkB family protein [Halegenticoccus soli]|uniref:YihY/virulence factor BrkB family protein n=1 Tax=Halegenticoccus soli TaxID=1985678 RepID=UPI000C6DA276|nr:YihY/virulence factor BrkB family protein [Halegenticoccus soli]
MTNSRRWVGVLKAVAAVARERQVTLTAAGLAYHAFNALIPLALLLVVGVSVFEQVDRLMHLLEVVAGVDPARAGSSFRRATATTTGRARAAAIAVVILTWSAARMFHAVNTSFSEVYGTRKRRSAGRKAVDSAITLATVALAVGLLGVVGVSLSFVFDGVAWAVLSLPLLFLALLFVFVPMYYLFPGKRVTLREALPGALLSAAAWTVSGLGFRLYARTSESVQLYGVAGGALLLLTWLYLGGLALLLGGVLNAVLADRVEADYDWLPSPDVSRSDEESA